MRIISGDHRGRVIAAPAGQGTRPTSDRTRQALFNVLAHASWAPALAGARVLDLFAGSGALGLEALSRGAAFAAFVDMAPAAIAAITDNLRVLGLSDRGQALKRLAPRLGVWAGTPFDLVFVDPPYGKGLIHPALAALIEGRWLAPGAVLAVERAADEVLVTPDGFADLDDRVWGAAAVTFLRRGEAAS
ncbi:MAG: 16S rRNA (guanine(966)-N(2))-methyltransferase RsmD [Alphaproteobacteria bacterium]|nr:16S rRNA (guanine(966)-N(2))-methyltransferase RsmD [Alphaproteobacteria bacterium]